nr:helix-turn-helix domain-containing protein [Parafrankia elaeagni]
MSRFRLYPDAAEEEALLVHCGHARYVWNLACEQGSWWNPRRGPAPGYVEQNRQLTDARGDNPWLAAGSVIVQQQALRDYTTAMAHFFVVRIGGRRFVGGAGPRVSGSLR